VIGNVQRLFQESCGAVRAGALLACH